MAKAPAAADGAVSPAPVSPAQWSPLVADLSVAVEAAQRGDEDAFRVIYRAIQPGLLRYLRLHVGDAAEDVASETWLQIARDLRTFHGDTAGFRGWAATIARHRAMDYLRHQRRLPPADGPVEQLTALPADDDTAGAALEAMSTGHALALISGLPRDQAEAVLLRVVMGLDGKTAARVLGKRPGAVRTAAYRGLRGLATQLAQAGRNGATATGNGFSPHTVTQNPVSALKDMR